MTAVGSSAMLGDGKKIIVGGGSGSALHGVRQRAHRQKRQKRLWPPTVSLSGVRRVPCTHTQEPRDRPGAQERGAAGRGHRTLESAGSRARFRRGPAHDLTLARKKAAACPPLSQTLLPAEPGDVLELDELWSFVGSKANARWVWIALCRQTRQVVAYFLGDRSADSAHALRARIPPAYGRRATRSDFWLPYAEVFPRRTHRLCDKKEGETCHVERWNNTLRQRLGRFVRRTLSFSKSERMHELALRLFIHEYNQQPVI
jgi:insertion element IS1 protein InsB